MRAITRFRLAAAPQLAVVVSLIALISLALALGLGTDASVAHGSEVHHSRASVESPLARGVHATAARFRLSHAAMTAESGQMVAVRGRLLAAAPGKKIELLARIGRAWRVVGHGRTTAGGGFRIRYKVRSVGAIYLRVSESTPGTAATTASAGQIVGLAPAIASWYYDAGNTACGFHATYGVANRTLPCGTKVTISYGGRSVVATVDDRGPFVYGRSVDLNQNTARALGMDGVAQVLTSV